MWMPPTTTTMDSRWLPGGESKMIFVTFQYSGWYNENTETKWCLDAIQKWNGILDIAILDVAILDVAILNLWRLNKK